MQYVGKGKAKNNCIYFFETQYTYDMGSDTDLSATEAAEMLGVTPTHVAWYWRNGYLPGRRIGKRVLVFRRADVEAFVKPTKTGRPKVSRKPGRPATKADAAAPAAPKPSTVKGKRGPKGGKPS